MKQCWKCGVILTDNIFGKLSFRANCEKCDADLHCCKNCKFYKPGLPNDCAVPGTDFIPDREKNNFCEEFSLLGVGPIKKNEDSKKGFDNLFK